MLARCLLLERSESQSARGGALGSLQRIVEDALQSLAFGADLLRLLKGFVRTEISAKGRRLD